MIVYNVCLNSDNELTDLCNQNLADNFSTQMLLNYIYIDFIISFSITLP
jgi:hypothetical protein